MPLRWFVAGRYENGRNKKNISKSTNFRGAVESFINELDLLIDKVGDIINRGGLGMALRVVYIPN